MKNPAEIYQDLKDKKARGTKYSPDLVQKETAYNQERLAEAKALDSQYERNFHTSD